MNTQQTEQKICAVICQRNGIKAREIAKELGLDVIFAGSFLGNERSSSVLRNQGFRLVFIRYGEHEEKIFMLAPELWKHTV